MDMRIIKPTLLGILISIYWLYFGLGPSAEEIYVLITFASLYALAGLVSVAVWPAISLYIGVVYSGLWIFGFICWYVRFLSLYEYGPTHLKLFGLVFAIAMILIFMLVVASYFSRRCHEKIRSLINPI